LGGPVPSKKINEDIVKPEKERSKEVVFKYGDHHPWDIVLKDGL
jgi:hypothetical protein